ncbi:MAG: hypothetical protein EB060_01145 [Proteobacteria bacterium]|nr:hypothetical protein [Pseudomonadota bacterium]
MNRSITLPLLATFLIAMVLGCANGQPPPDEKKKKDETPKTEKKDVTPKAKDKKADDEEPKAAPKKGGAAAKIKKEIEDDGETKIRGAKITFSSPKKGGDIAVEAVVVKDTVTVVVLSMPKGSSFSSSQPLSIQWSWEDREGTVDRSAQEYLKEWRAERDTILTITKASKE